LANWKRANDFLHQSWRLGQNSRLMETLCKPSGVANEALILSRWEIATHDPLSYFSQIPDYSTSTKRTSPKLHSLHPHAWVSMVTSQRTEKSPWAVHARWDGSLFTGIRGGWEARGWMDSQKIKALYWRRKWRGPWVFPHSHLFCCAYQPHSSRFTCTYKWHLSAPVPALGELHQEIIVVYLLLAPVGSQDHARTLRTRLQILRKPSQDTFFSLPGVCVLSSI
jgi:hypothetical protein